MTQQSLLDEEARCLTQNVISPPGQLTRRSQSVIIASGHFKKKQHTSWKGLTPRHANLRRSFG
jgi:hypothetical protein